MAGFGLLRRGNKLSGFIAPTTNMCTPGPKERSSRMPEFHPKLPQKSNTDSVQKTAVQLSCGHHTNTEGPEGLH